MATRHAMQPEARQRELSVGAPPSSRFWPVPWCCGARANGHHIVLACSSVRIMTHWSPCEMSVSRSAGRDRTVEQPPHERACSSAWTRACSSAVWSRPHSSCDASNDDIPGAIT
jgi:hypothetical protein